MHEEIPVSEWSCVRAGAQAATRYALVQILVKPFSNLYYTEYYQAQRRAQIEPK